MKRLWLLLLGVPWLAAQVVPGQYIVELAGEPAATSGRMQIRARRAQIRAAQAPVRRAIEQRGAVVLDSLDTVANALIVRLADGQAAQLGGIPGVARVYPALTARLNLDHALPLTRAPQAWARIGGQDAAGAGVKIAVIDTGIDPDHPGFQDPNLTVPPGYPIGDPAFTNNKIIVARSYVPASPALDRLGHGTAVAMTAAGATNTGPLATITGVAPKAWLGNYKLSDDPTFSTSLLLKALDDAVADGMDIINISSGVAVAQRLEDDIVVKAVERASRAGVLVVASAGNIDADPDGNQPNTIGSPATAPSVIAVGASTNDQMYLPAIAVDGLPHYVAVPGSGPAPDAPIAAPILDVSTLDPTGLACSPLPAGSLNGRIALIQRGTCYFEDKVNNAQAGGALAAVIYNNDTDNPQSLISMNTGQATLPSASISYAAAMAVKWFLQDKPSAVFTVFITLGFPARPNLLWSFSSRGPDVDGTIKPDLVAVGGDIYTATQKNTPSGEMYDKSGYIVTDGTSFSSPLAAGAAAVLKAFRPGLTVAQYRSLLINSGTAMVSSAGKPLSMQWSGGGVLNVDAALAGTAAAAPASLSFRIGGAAPDFSQDLTITNLGAAADLFTITVTPQGDGPAPAVSSDTVPIDAGASQTVHVRLTAAGLGPGEYQGMLHIQGSQSSQEARVPYWYGIPSGTPKYITILRAPFEAAPAGRATISFRVTDASGIVVGGVTPTVTAGTGGGTVLQVNAIDDLSPGVFAADVRLGPARGTDSFTIAVGDLTKEVLIAAKGSAP